LFSCDERSGRVSICGLERRPDQVAVTIRPICAGSFSYAVRMNSNSNVNAPDAASRLIVQRTGTLSEIVRWLSTSKKRFFRSHGLSGVRQDHLCSVYHPAASTQKSTP
jgi:hypothetical protein